jgi:hypothetical protein
MDRISTNAYPGRGVVLGMTPEGLLVQVYWIMGRSANSRNRVFVAENGEMRTEAADPSQVKDPSLIIYRAVAEQKSDNSKSFVLTNGDHTDTIMDALAQGDSFENALRTRCHEPDAPNYTPRISGIFELKDSSVIGKMSILKKSPLDTTGNISDRQFFEYDFRSPGLKGNGLVITTYASDGNPLPSFEGAPFMVPIVGKSGEDIADSFWPALNEDNKVSLAVKVIDPSTGESSLTLRNKYSKA